MSGALPAGAAFAEARPERQEGKDPLLPVQPWPHCYFFQLKKENISSSSSRSALGSQRAEDGRGRMGKPLPRQR